MSDDSKDMIVSILPEQGTPAERALVRAVPPIIADAYARLGGPAGAAAVLADTLASGRTDGGKTGMTLRAVLLEQHVRKVNVAGADKDITHLSLLVIDSAVKAFQARDKGRDGKSCIAYVGEERAFGRVDAAYPLSPADIAHLGGPAALGANRKKGYVSVGLKPLSTGMVIKVSLYGVSGINYGSQPARPGSYLSIGGVTFTCDWNETDGVSQTVHCSGRDDSFRVLKSDEQNSQRLEAALQSVNFVPLLEPPKCVRMSSEWPAAIATRNECSKATAQMLLLREAERSARGGGSATAGISMIEGRPGAAAGDDDEDDDTVLRLRSRPLVMPGGDMTFVAHLGETMAQQMARSASNLTANVRTVFGLPILSTSKEAVLFKKSETVTDCHAQFSFVCRQTNTNDPTGAVLTSVIHCTVQPGEAMQMLTGFPTIDKQAAIVPSLIAGLCGPFLIEPRQTEEHDYNVELLAGAKSYVAYINHLAPSVLQQTVRRAGLRVSPTFMLVERAAVNSIEKLNAARAAVSSLFYYTQDGHPTNQSNLLILGLTAQGFFDEESIGKITARMAPIANQSQAERRRALAQLLPELKGPVVDVMETHAGYYVGFFVPTAQIIEHQLALNETDPAALMAGNEQMLLTRNVPDGWPVCYENLLSGADIKRCVQYAVKKSIANGEETLQRIKRQLESIGSNSKRPALEAAAAPIDEEMID